MAQDQFKDITKMNDQQLVQLVENYYHDVSLDGGDEILTKEQIRYLKKQKQ